MPGVEEDDSSNNEARKRTRRQAEIYLSRLFLDTVATHGRDILDRKLDRRRQEREGLLDTGRIGVPGNSFGEDLTEEERSVFNRSSYYNYFQGSVAGLATFGVLYGALRWAASRRGGGGSSHYALPLPPRPSYQQLDGTTAHSRRSIAKPPPLSAPRSSSSGEAKSHSFLGVPDDAMSQLQFMCIGAMSLVVGNLVAQSFADQERFFRQLERVPLMPGRSAFCHRACPDLVRQHRDLLRHNSWDRLLASRGLVTSSTGEGASQEPRAASEPGSPSSSSASKARHTPDFTPGDLMRDPETQELESMVRLIRNCEARMAYETELRGSSGGEGGTAAATDAIVTVPPPGVPNFGIAVPSHESE